MEQGIRLVAKSGLQRWGPIVHHATTDSTAIMQIVAELSNSRKTTYRVPSSSAKGSPRMAIEMTERSTIHAVGKRLVAIHHLANDQVPHAPS